MGDRGQVSAISPNSPLFRLLQPQWDATFLEPPLPSAPPSLVSCIRWRGVLMISTHLCPLFRYSHLLRTSWEHPLSTLWVTVTPSVMCTYTLWSLLVLLATVFAQTKRAGCCAEDCGQHECEREGCAEQSEAAHRSGFCFRDPSVTPYETVSSGKKLCPSH